MNASTTTVKQTFSFKDPAAHSVLLAGDFTHWLKSPIALKKRPDGIWRTTVSLTLGTHHYRFFVNGEWHDDPECTITVQNPFGTQNSAGEAPASKSETTEPVPAAARSWGL